MRQLREKCTENDLLYLVDILENQGVRRDLKAMSLPIGSPAVPSHGPQEFTEFMFGGREVIGGMLLLLGFEKEYERGAKMKMELYKMSFKMAEEQLKGKSRADQISLVRSLHPLEESSLDSTREMDAGVRERFKEGGVDDGSLDQMMRESDARGDFPRRYIYNLIK